jgi:transposase
LPAGQFIDKLRYKLGLHGITLVVTDESYNRFASFVDGDKLPKKYNPKRKKPQTFQGKRIKRGLYKTANGTLVNADVNGAYNILRKTDNTFSFAHLVNQVGAQIKTWLHPIQRIRFLKRKTHQPSRFKRRKKLSDPSQSIRRGDKGLILPDTQYVKCLPHFVDMSIFVYKIVICSLISE